MNNNPAKTVKNEKDVENKAPEEQEKITIMPTMIDESEERIEKKRDLSAIIPKFEDSTENENGIELISKEKNLKGDGAIAIALINGDGEATLTANAALPTPIDIEERKKARQRNKNGKLKKEKKKNNKSAQKFQNITALCSLAIIIFLVGFWYWFKNRPTENDFTPLHVKVEIGESLPIRTSSYVKPGVGKEVDELKYALDLSEVVVEEVGDYNFTVQYNGIKKNGIVSIVDTTPPELSIRKVTIKEGVAYDASMFVADCKDPSGCNYSFQDTETEKKYTTKGSYIVYVVATDAYQNSVTKQATLTIEAEGVLQEYAKSYIFDTDTGYEVREVYSLYFTNLDNNAVLLNGTHETVYIYHDDEVYERDSKTYSGEVNYSCDDARREITKIETLTVVGSNYTSRSDIDTYLKREGFYLRK